MTQELSESNFNRLATSLTERHGYTYDEAVQALNSYTLSIVCGADVVSSIPLQAALISAANAGKRAFLGGVSVSLPPGETDCLVLNYKGKKLSRVLEDLGVSVYHVVTSDLRSFTLTIGVRPEQNEKSLEIVCNDWQGGVTNYSFPTELPGSNQFALGGVAAAAIAVGAAFLIVSGIDKRCADKPIGVSLWRPDLDWLDPKSGGESIESLPAKLWVLGLGHLGQAYLWAMSFLPYTESSTPLIMLQDDDDIVEANYGAGLLTEEKHVGQKKTRRCATWLEDLHYTTLITERKFDSITKRSDGEPFIAVCGFDNAQSRIHLENAGFDLVVECGIGGKLDSFDDFTIHTFPGTARTPAQLWGAPSEAEVNKSILKEIKAIEEEKCGALYDALSKKAISTAFVGMLAGAFVIAEVVRAANCGTRYEQVNFQLRCQKYMGAYIMGTYSTEAARNGVLPVNYEASPYVEPLD